MHGKWSNHECVVFNLQQKYEVIKISMPNKNITSLYFVMKNTLQMKEANVVNIMCFIFQQLKIFNQKEIGWSKEFLIKKIIKNTKNYKRSLGIF
jgi:hypothetical protein